MYSKVCIIISKLIDSSTRNTCIECLWVKEGSQFARPWKAFFLQLERLHNLLRDNAHHLWLPHNLFLPLINADCNNFQSEWNRHQISGKATIGKELSPSDMHFLSEAKQGVVDDHENVNPNILQQYYGVEIANIDVEDEEEVDTDSEDSDYEDTDNEVDDIEVLQEQLEGNEIAAAHEAVPVPANIMPFASDNTFQLFQQTLQQLQNEGIVPHDYGVSLEEIQRDGYPAEEILQSSRRGQKEMCITLPIAVWLPRAFQWCQTLEVMTTVLVVQDD